MIGLLGALAAATLPQARSPENVLEGELIRRGFSIEKARELAAKHGLPFPLVAEELVMAHDAGHSEVTLPDLSWTTPRRPVMGRQVDPTPTSEPPAAVTIRTWTATADSSDKSIAVHTADTRPLGEQSEKQPAPRCARVRDRSAQKENRKRRAGRRTRRGW